jgi:hypothetical protein
MQLSKVNIIANWHCDELPEHVLIAIVQVDKHTSSGLVIETINGVRIVENKLHRWAYRMDKIEREEIFRAALTKPKH